MNKKLIMTAAALLALTTLAGCNIKPGGQGGKESSSEVDTRVTVTLDLNYEGAPAPTTLKVEKGGYAEAPADPEREGFYFDGWFRTPEDGEDAFEFVSTPIDDDITLYAYWTAAYNVTFYLNAPEQEQSVYETQTVRAGSLVTAPVDPKLSGYSFKGWFNTAACEDEDEFSFTRRINANASAYAKWEEPDWSVVEDAVKEYFGYLYDVFDVRVPKFPNSNYEFKQYSDCLLISGPDKCIAEYTPTLTDAGYTVTATEAGFVASNDYVDLQLVESEEKGFTMYAIVKGTSEAASFDPTAYFVFTQQNYVSIPESVLSMFSKFETMRVTLDTDNHDPAALLSMYLPAKTDENKTDAEYYNENLAAMKAAFVAAGFESGSFNGGGDYIIDPAHLAMNQIYAYDEASPLEIKFLSYSYLGVNGGGVSFNKIVPELVAKADALAAEYNKGAWVPTATLNVDLSALAATYAVNKKNFVVQYDYFKTTVETNIVGIDSFAGLNAVSRAVMMSVANDAEWELMVDQSAAAEFQAYSAYHYVIADDGSKTVDAKMYFDVYQGSDGEDQAIANLGCGYILKVYFSPASSEWADEDIANYLDLQALTGDTIAIPEYTGSFNVCEAGASLYGDYYHVFLLNTVEAEATAYAEALASNGFTLDVDESDVANGEYAYVSASGNFKVYAYVGQDTLDLYISAYVTHTIGLTMAGLTELNTVLNERNGLQFPVSLVSSLTGKYTSIDYVSFYNMRYGVGDSTVILVSNVAAEGDTTDLKADVALFGDYLVSLGWEYNEQYKCYTNGALTEIDIAINEPDDDYDTYVIEINIMCNPSGDTPSYTPHEALEAALACINAVLQSPVEIKTSGTTEYIAFSLGVGSAQMKAYIAQYFTPADFSVYLDWTADQFSDGTAMEYLILACGNTYLNYTIYASGNGGTVLQITAGTLSA